MMKIKDWHILIVFMLLGFLIRIYNLAYQSIWIDEAFSLNAARAVIETGIPVLKSGFLYSGYIFHTYLISLFMLLFPNQLFGARLISVIFGTLLIPAVYLLARKVFDRKVALLSSLFVTFSYILVAWSRQARMYIMFVFFFVLSLYLFLELCDNPSRKNIILTCIATLLAILSHPIGSLLIAIYCLYFIVLFIVNRKSGILKWRFVIPVFIAWLLGGLYFLYSIKIGFRLPIDNYFLSYYEFISHAHLTVFYLGLVGLLLAFLYEKKSFLLFFSMLIPFMFVSFFVILRHFRYLLVLLPVLFILVSYFIFKLIEMRDYTKYQKIVAILLFIVFLAAVYSDGFAFIPQKEYSLELETPQPDFNRAYSWLQNQSYDILLADYPAVAQYYHVYPNYSFNFSMSGLSSELNRTTDVYTNTTLITTDGEFQALTAGKSVVVIMDKLCQRRMDQNLAQYIRANLNHSSDASSSSGIYSGVDVYYK